LWSFLIGYTIKEIINYKVISYYFKDIVMM
jgi:hypothetical protein